MDSTFLLFLCNRTQSGLDLLGFALVHLIRCLVVMRSMEPLPVVKAHVALDSDLQLSKRAVVVEINVLVLQRPPEALDEDVVQGPIHAIRADPYAIAVERSGESL